MTRQPSSFFLFEKICYFPASHASSCACFSAIISSIPALLSSFSNCGIASSGLRSPQSSALAYFALTLLHAAICGNTFSLFHTKPFAIELMVFLFHSRVSDHSVGESVAHFICFCIWTNKLNNGHRFTGASFHFAFFTRFGICNARKGFVCLNQICSTF